MDKLRAALTAGRALEQREPDEPAVVLFTSGSEGVPKGVALSHANILANIAQIDARFDMTMTDVVFNPLPIFHAFGLTGGLLLGLIGAMRVYLYPTPLHYRQIPELIYGNNATVLLGADTFLAGYARSANSYDFRSLRYVIAGAEPVKAETRRIYMEKFGLRILEGYGVTEGSPVLAVNTPMFNKIGTVGKLLPFIEPRLEHVPGIDEGGRLLVSGPNIMIGYFRADNPGELERPLWRLARHRRHRGDRRGGLCRDQGTRQALRQDRRRDSSRSAPSRTSSRASGPTMSSRSSPRPTRKKASG